MYPVVLTREVLGTVRPLTVERALHSWDPRVFVETAGIELGLPSGEGRCRAADTAGSRGPVPSAPWRVALHPESLLSTV